MTTVQHEDLRTLGFCNRGSRAFFERHGLDWAEFMQVGIPADRLLATDDDMAKQAVEQARKREGGDQ